MSDLEWHIYIDGASSGNPGESGAGVVIYAQDKLILKEGLYLGRMTNNMAEYEALLIALKKAVNAGIERVCIYTDSQLVANQVSGVYKVKNPVLGAYISRIKKMLGNFKHFSIKYIPRDQNRVADSIARLAIKNRGRQVTAPQSGEESPGIAGQDGP